MDVDELRSTLDDLAAEGELSGLVTAGRIERIGVRRRRTHRAVVTLSIAAGVLALAGGAAAVVGRTTASPSARVSIVRPKTTTTRPRGATQVFYVPSASMAPTLQADERVLVDTGWYERHAIHRGDIIVFKAPAGKAAGPTNSKWSVKRVIGLPGDRISIGPWPTASADLHPTSNPPVYIIPAGESVSHELTEPYVKPTPDCPAGTQSPGAGRTLNPTTVPAG